jgi:hypothetical protein
MTSAVALITVLMGALVSLGAADWKAPRTPWGEPDLQGVWTGQAELGVPFERPAAFADKPRLTEEELSSLKARAAQLFAADADAAQRDLREI